ncbi:MAG: hypothetical protein Q7U84_01910 [Polynucleobacter sp.]|nr:hypothetical protein [Polynucleobacter sp.]
MFQSLRLSACDVIDDIICNRSDCKETRSLAANGIEGNTTEGQNCPLTKTVVCPTPVLCVDLAEYVRGNIEVNIGQLLAEAREDDFWQRDLTAMVLSAGNHYTALWQAAPRIFAYHDGTGCGFCTVLRSRRHLASRTEREEVPQSRSEIPDLDF